MNNSKPPRIYDTAATVVSQKPSGSIAYTITLECEEIAKAARPIQFVNIAPMPLLDGDRPNPSMDMLLRRPLGFSEVRPAQGRFDIIYQVVGRGTKMLSGLKPGDRVGILGPLGRPLLAKNFNSDTVILAGGGLGLPPLCDLTPELLGSGREVIVVVGARSKDLLVMDAASHALKRPLGEIKDTMGLKPFTEMGADCIITLDNPAPGFLSGLVTEPLKKLLADDFKGGVEIVACGPPMMLKAIAEIAKAAAIKCRLIMEARMGCGLGACQACACRTTDGYKRVCTEGPVFDADQIVWEDANA